MTPGIVTDAPMHEDSGKFSRAPLYSCFHSTADCGLFRPKIEKEVANAAKAHHKTSKIVVRLSWPIFLRSISVRHRNNGASSFYWRRFNCCLLFSHIELVLRQRSWLKPKMAREFVVVRQEN